MTPRRSKTFSSYFKNLPSIVWILIFILGIAAFIGGILGLFYLLSHIEGVASIIMLVVAWGVIRLGSSVTSDTDSSPSTGRSLITAACITFFALMGVAIDQTGNLIYNKPLEWFFCPSGAQLKRGVVVTNPVPGQTNVSQDFSCVTPGEVPSVSRIGVFKIIAVRFGEYILIGYALIGLNRLYSYLRRMKSREIT